MLQRFFRTVFIALSKAGWAKRMVTGWGFAWRVASRFIAGNTLDQAIAAIQALNERGINATLDYLGESTTSPAEARAAAEEVLRALDVIDQTGVRSNFSLKLSQLGLNLDEALCKELLSQVLGKAQALNTFIRIDMEDSPYTETTLTMWEWAQAQGFTNVGLVIQSYLYRSEKDICRILERNGRVRLVKGAYQEPAAVAFPKKKDVDANFDQLTTQLLEGELKAGAPEISQDGRTPPIPAIASHDELRIRYAIAEVNRLGLPKGAVEFQMLYGIRRELQERLVREGYPVRVYVPYGTHWYPYFMRRLAERPSNLWFFVSNFFKR